MHIQIQSLKFLWVWWFLPYSTPKLNLQVSFNLAVCLHTHQNSVSMLASFSVVVRLKLYAHQRSLCSVFPRCFFPLNIFTSVQTLRLQGGLGYSIYLFLFNYWLLLLLLLFVYLFIYLGVMESSSLWLFVIMLNQPLQYLDLNVCNLSIF